MEIFGTSNAIKFMAHFAITAISAGNCFATTNPFQVEHRIIRLYIIYDLFTSQLLIRMKCDNHFDRVFHTHASIPCMHRNFDFGFLRYFHIWWEAFRMVELHCYSTENVHGLQVHFKICWRPFYVFSLVSTQLDNQNKQTNQIEVI